MLKSLFILFNLFSLIVVTALLPADVKVDMSIEEEMVQDSTYLVEITIHKAKIYGFAKFQHDLPKGFVARPVETSDASFTFADDKVKFIWMALPEADEIKISYELTPSADTPSDGMVEGKFSYIEDNARKSYDLPNIPVKVKRLDDLPQEVEAVASISRTIEDRGDNNYLVTLSIEKQGISGFAKIEEFLPEGVEAVAGDVKLAVFSQVDEKTKFVWMSVPAEESFSVTYEVKAERNVLNELNGMEGNFSFLDEDQTKSVPVMSSGEPVVVAQEETIEEVEEENGEKEEIVAVDETVTEEPAPKEELKDETSSAEETKPTEEVATTEPKEEKTELLPAKTESKEKPEQTIAEQPKDKKEKMASVTDVPDPETGVRYRVQIAAGHKMVNQAYIQKTYNFTADYSTENHQGWIKYTTGSFDQYRQARDKREALVAAKHNFPGPFVAAYNSGERITVQEALMITNQKWVQ